MPIWECPTCPVFLGGSARVLRTEGTKSRDPPEQLGEETMIQSYRDSHLDRGTDYDEGWSTIPHRAMMWRLEQRALDSIFARAGGRRFEDYLDFACGTGRMLGFLGKYAQSVTGVDISPSMLEVARERVPKAELICGDLTREPLLTNRQFDVISAFRFFPNATRNCAGMPSPNLCRI